MSVTGPEGPRTSSSDQQQPVFKGAEKAIGRFKKIDPEKATELQVLVTEISKMTKFMEMGELKVVQLYYLRTALVNRALTLVKSRGGVVNKVALRSFRKEMEKFGKRLDLIEKGRSALVSRSGQLKDSYSRLQQTPLGSARSKEIKKQIRQHEKALQGFRKGAEELLSHFQPTTQRYDGHLIGIKNSLGVRKKELDLLKQVSSLADRLAALNKKGGDPSKLKGEYQQLVAELDRSVKEAAGNVTELPVAFTEIRSQAVTRINKSIQQELQDPKHWRSKMDAMEVDGALQRMEPGAYVVRQSHTFPSQYVLSARTEDGPQSILLRIEGGKLNAVYNDGSMHEIESVQQFLKDIIHLPNPRPVSRNEMLTQQVKNPVKHFYDGDNGTQMLRESVRGSYLIEPGKKPGIFTLRYKGANDRLVSKKFEVERGLIRLKGGALRKEKHFATVEDFLSSTVGQGGITPTSLGGRIERQRLRKLYEEDLRPLMERFGLSLMKVSRQKYPWLQHSYFVTDDGKFLQQIHRSDRANKGFIDQGGVKIVYDLKGEGEGNAYVRGRAHKDESYFNPEHFAKLTRELGKLPHVAVGEYCVYKSSGKKTKGQRRHVWIMPRMNCDLLKLGQMPEFTGGGALRKQAMTQIVQGLVEMHSAGWAHMDIKPENCLANYNANTGDLDARLADFDFAVSREFSNVDGLRAGSPGYIAPEVQLRGVHNLEEAKKADIFSMGVTLYVLSCGKNPDITGGGGLTAFLTEKQLQSNFEDREPPKSPDSMDRLLYEMMSIDPSKRPSAEMVSQRLQKISFMK
ncbi:MAG: protein kinase [Waddliaceae bacterium]